MKKILSIAGIVCFSMLVAVGTHGIYSWFTDQSQRVNSFSVGMNEVEDQGRISGSGTYTGENH